MSNNIEHIECLIVGSGPAGYTAAIYAARADMKPVMYAGMQPGGQLTITTDVENYPGYPEGIMGPEMMELFRKQAERFGTDIRYGMITSVDFSGKPPFKLIADENHEIHAETVIIATGASAKWLGIPSEEKLNGRGVSACAVCDGFFFKGKDVAIVGAGDEFRASKAMQNRVLATPNIEVLFNSETDEILGETKVEGARIKNRKTGEMRNIEISGFFVAIGHQPNTGIFKDYLTMDETGYLLTIPGTSKTNIEGVFACGDAQDKVYRQAVTAAGSGCMAALDAERYLAAKGDVAVQ
jgi:thioredoxin reductase (NADPH)